MSKKTPTPSITFEYLVPGTVDLTMPRVRKTLRVVQAQLLSHGINGGGKKLKMDTITMVNRCGMAACIGGWTVLFLLGFDHTRNEKLEGAAYDLFSVLITFDWEHGNGNLHSLFHGYADTDDYNQPNIAATAIKRYLAGKNPWPEGTMPDILPYTKRPSKR